MDATTWKEIDWIEREEAAEILKCHPANVNRVVKANDYIEGVHYQLVPWRGPKGQKHIYNKQLLQHKVATLHQPSIHDDYVTKYLQSLHGNPRQRRAKAS